MIRLPAKILSVLSDVHSRSHMDKAPEGEELPFIVFKLPNSDIQGEREDFILEVDIWDKERSGYDVRTEVTNLTEDVDQALNKLVHLEQGFLTRLHKINQLSVPDDDNSIWRRQLRYRCLTYNVKE